MAADSRLCTDSMLELSPAHRIDAVRVIGGLTRNALYMKIKAAMLGRPVTVVELADSVAMGAALLAGIGAGIYEDLADAYRQIRTEEHEVPPDPEAMAVYDRLVHDAYARAYPALHPLHEAVERAIGAA
jgi:xylulokinase